MGVWVPKIGTSHGLLNAGPNAVFKLKKQDNPHVMCSHLTAPPLSFTFCPQPPPGGWSNVRITESASELYPRSVSLISATGQNLLGFLARLLRCLSRCIFQLMYPKNWSSVFQDNFMTIPFILAFGFHPISSKDKSPKPGENGQSSV